MIFNDKDTTDIIKKMKVVHKPKAKYFSDHLKFLYGIKLKNNERKKLNKGRTIVNPSILVVLELLTLCVTIIALSLNITGFTIESKYVDNLKLTTISNPISNNNAPNFFFDINLMG
ncbi:hypothetical protein THALO_70027 [Tenacibaculum halocynthiae]